MPSEKKPASTEPEIADQLLDIEGGQELLLRAKQDRAASQRDATLNVGLTQLDASQGLAYQQAKIVSFLSLAMGLVMTSAATFVGYRAWSFIPENVTITLLLAVGLLVGLGVVIIGQMYSGLLRNSARALEAVTKADFDAADAIEKAEAHLREVESHIEEPRSSLAQGEGRARSGGTEQRGTISEAKPNDGWNTSG